MKKLMIACAVTISAFALQAAMFQWSAAMITDGKDGPVLTAATAPGVFGIMNLTTGQFQQGEFEFGTGENGGGGVFNLTVDVDKDGDIMSLMAYNDVSGTYTQVMNSDGTAAQVALAGFGNDPMSIKVNYLETMGGYVESVPEPTSGLLLLLGVAGLALKRRRA